MPVADEDAALQAIAGLQELSHEQIHAQKKIDGLLINDAPFIDIHELFRLYDILYFRSLLYERVEVSWSARLTLCAGICELVRDPKDNNRYSKVRLKLSEPLLKFRPRSDVVNTLLHEAIHAYFFITTSWRHSRGDDGTGHGAGFLLLADAINDHGAEHGYEITVFHTFHDEVDLYRTHIWQCDGPCRAQSPFFGLVKRSMNRAPGKSDTWWAKHEQECGGTYTKIAEPKATQASLDKLTGLQRAGRQKNKIDGYVRGAGAEPSAALTATSPHASDPKERRSPPFDHNRAKRVRQTVECPICVESMPADTINAHLDTNHTVT